ncbi:MAG: biotin synthase BioB [Elusimicrobia bacterium]|nr:biotin synthase BioB [Candidatus Liberimonas magnetica]
MSELEKLCDSIIDGNKISLIDAKNLVKADIYELFYFANRLRANFKKDEIKLCGVVNAKSGMCTQDCKFCAQSSFNDTSVKAYHLLDEKDLNKAYEKAVSAKLQCFGVVTSGHGLSSPEIDRVCSFLSKNKRKNLKLSTSLGIIEKKDLKKLKQNGASRFHHNLETSESFFPKICTTHEYSQRVNTVKNAREAGLEVCSGGIFGLGEGFNERLELAFTLRGLDVDSVPLNFLNPIKGTPLETRPRLKALDALRIISIYRFILPDKDISVCGGREITLGDLQSFIFYAGANAMMVGDYLTTQGRPLKKDLKMIHDLGLKIYFNE